MSDSNTSGKADPTPLSKQVWADYCDTLKRTGEYLLQSGVPLDDFNQAEGLRYLTRMVRAGLESIVESSEPQTPRLGDPEASNIKIGADNPDNIYKTARIRSDYEYLIHGSPGDVPTLNFATKKGGYQKQSMAMVGTGFLDGRDLALNADGTFDIVVSLNRPASGNWLPMEVDSNLLLIRQTFHNRSRERPADLLVSCTTPAKPPAPLVPEAMTARLMAAARYTENTVKLFTDWALLFKREHHNTLPLGDQALFQAAGGDPNITYYHGYWELHDDEAMLIETRVPQCEFWNFQVDNFWMESLDYRNHRIHVNSHTAQVTEDGWVTIVLAHNDPGHPNWVTTAGHALGTSLFRVIGGQQCPDAINTRVVPLSMVSAEGLSGC